MLDISNIYKLVVESLLLENMSLEEIYRKYYSLDVPDFETFKKINDVNPNFPKDRKGKYLDWLIKKAYKTNPQRFEEDVDKIAEDLQLFDKYQKKIGKQITQIKDANELSILVKEFRAKKDAGEIDLSRSEIKKDVEKIYEDNSVIILSPKSEEAAKYYGKGTRWCTSAENNNRFNQYNKQGPLYILLYKRIPSEKYQFHFQSQQYMNASDEEIQPEDYDFPTPIMDKLVELAIKNENIKFIKELPSLLQEKYKKIYSKEYAEYQHNINLYASIENGHLEGIKMNIERGADIHANNEKALRLAIQTSQLDVVKYLVSLGAKTNIKVDNSFLDYPIQNEDLPLIKYLVESGAKIHGSDLTTAAYHGHLDIVKYLVENGADVHYNNDAALINASYASHLHIVKYLVEKGANIHAENDYIFKYHTSYKNDKIREYLQSIVDKEKK